MNVKKEILWAEKMIESSKQNREKIKAGKVSPLKRACLKIREIALYKIF